jgi:NAD(P)-dependent dehydrogenase (short-subunit alcohol dehydrogenase family)/acyl carrier protein
VLLELALTAAHRLGMEAIEALHLEAPLIVPERGGVQLQLSVSAPDAEERRSLWLHSRREDLGPDGAWTRHASGTLGSHAPQTAADLRVWPPPGATAYAIDDTYENLADAGLQYGETWRVLHAAYRRGDEWFAELKLPERAHVDAARYTLHPALLEAAQHLLALREQTAEISLVSSWRGVGLRATGATELRVRLGPSLEAGSVSLSLADAAGEPLGEIAVLTARPAAASELRGSAAQLDGLYRVDWLSLPLSAAPAEAWSLLGGASFTLAEPAARYMDVEALQAELDAGAPAPKLVVYPCFAVSLDAPSLPLYAATQSLLAVLQAWVADERLAATELVILTRGAIAASDSEDVPDLAHAPLWGMIRTAQSEYSDRGLRLLDLDAEPASAAAFLAALHAKEPQLALRAGQALAPRLAKSTVSDASAPIGPLAEGTVLITGGTGALGALLARHLVAQHGARNLLLCSRSGRADDLAAELRTQGAAVSVAACDVADRSALEQLLHTIPAEHPLVAVFHTAGITDDGVLMSQTSERVAAVFASKVSGAWHLHELTQQQPLAAFVMFSSVAGVLGSAGQSNYAAANAFLDALAHQRRARGLPATSLDWGYWAERSAISERLGKKDRARITRGGIDALSAEQGMTLLDAALSCAQPQLVPVRFNFAALREAEFLPAVMRGLVRGRLQRVSAAASFKSRLASQPRVEQEALVLQLVRTAVASVASAELSDIKPNRPLQEFGLDSLMALELRKYLAARTGLRLSTTLLYDYPTPAKLARLLHGKLSLELPNGTTPVLAELDRLEELLEKLDAAASGHDQLAARLKLFTRKWGLTSAQPSELRAVQQNLYQADDDQLYKLIDESLSQ